MPTYKKRGHIKSKSEDQLKANQSSTTAEVFEKLDSSASRAEIFVAKYQNFILIFIGIIAFSVLVFLGYKSFIYNPLLKEATSELNQAQYYFNIALNEENSDSLYLRALNGGEGKYGFIDIIENYSGTPAAELAKYSAGMSYMKLKDYKNAIYYLDEFSSKDLILLSLAYGSIGDAYLELNEHDKSLKFYEKAFGLDENNFTTPKFLFKAGLLSSSLNKKNKALKYFKKITNDFPDSREYNFVEAQIGRLENIN